jgi:hypothetical protein
VGVGQTAIISVEKYETMKSIKLFSRCITDNGIWGKTKTWDIY